MKIIGLTGGIGMGKSTSAQFLRARGVPITDTDELARVVVEPGQPALAEIREVFGSAVLGHDGRLNREAMAALVFSDPGARKRLESILHPRIRLLWQAQAAAWGKEGRPLGVVVIPLLFETEAQKELDAVICVACSATTQRARLLARGWSSEHLEQRINSQLQIEQKMARADFVIWSEGNMAVHSEQLDRVLQSIAGR